MLDFSEFDPVLLIEAAFVLLIVVIQFIIFFNNNGSIKKLRKTFPDASSLEVQYETASISADDSDPDSPSVEAGKTAVLVRKKDYSDTFLEITHDVNAYLLRNRGGANFQNIEAISTEKSRSMEDGIDTVIALPLYMGLVGTFTGVILGLVRITTLGVTSEAIQAFIGGVLIGMIASAIGLLLTVRSNTNFKNAKKQRDNTLFSFLNFVRMRLLAPAYKEIPTDFKNLRYNLAAFSEEFINYQRNLSGSLENTMLKFEELQNVFSEIKLLEPHMGNIAQALRINGSLVERQGQHMHDVTEKTDNLSQKLVKHLDDVDLRLQTLIGRSEQELIELKRNYQPITDYDQQDARQRELVSKLEATQQIQQQVSAQLNNIYMAIKEAQELATKPKGYMDSFGFKLFTFTGTLAFTLALVLGILHLVNNVLPGL